MMQFIWYVPQDGYEWVEARPVADGQMSHDAERFLTAGLTLQSRRSHPFQDTPALFRTFSEIEPTEVAVQAFASHYGALGDNQQILTPDGKEALGERLLPWVTEITLMRHTLRIWDALRERDHEALERWFHLEDAGVKYTPDEPFPLGVLHRLPQYGSDESFNAILAVVPASWLYPGDPAEVDIVIPSTPAGWAQAYVRHNVNARLSEHTGARLQPIPGKTRGVPLGVYIVPVNLLGALWLQLAQAIEGDIPYQRCPQCQQWFQVPAKARRPRTTYCSVRCRVQAHRIRQLRAHHLHADGTKIATIAAELGTPVDTIRGWLAKPPPGPGTGQRGRQPTSHQRG